MSRADTKKPSVKQYVEIENGTPTPYRFAHAQDSLYRKPCGGRIHMKDLANWAKDLGLGLPKVVMR